MNIAYIQMYAIWTHKSQLHIQAYMAMSLQYLMVHWEEFYCQSSWNMFPFSKPFGNVKPNLTIIFVDIHFFFHSGPGFKSNAVWKVVFYAYFEGIQHKQQMETFISKLTSL